MEGYNKSRQACETRQTAELKVSHVTTLVGVINPVLPPAPPLTAAGQPGVISWHAHMSNTSFCPLTPPPTPLSLFPSLLSAPVHVNMLRPLDTLARGFGDEHYRV